MCRLVGDGSVQNGERPVICCQNNVGNIFSTTTIVIPITSKNKNHLPTHYSLHKKDYPKLTYDENTILAEQIRVVNIKELGKFICTLKKDDIKNVQEIITNNFRLKD